MIAVYNSYKKTYKISFVQINYSSPQTCFSPVRSYDSIMAAGLNKPKSADKKTNSEPKNPSQSDQYQVKTFAFPKCFSRVSQLIWDHLILETPQRG